MRSWWLLDWTNGVRNDEHCSNAERCSCQVQCSTWPTGDPRERTWQAGPLRVRVTLPERAERGRAQGAADGRADRRHGDGADGRAGLRRRLDALAGQGARHRPGLALRARRQPRRARPAGHRPDRAAARDPRARPGALGRPAQGRAPRRCCDLYRDHPGSARAAMAHDPDDGGRDAGRRGDAGDLRRRRHLARRRRPGCATSPRSTSARSRYEEALWVQRAELHGRRRGARPRRRSTPSMVELWSQLPPELVPAADASTGAGDDRRRRRRPLRVRPSTCWWRGPGRRSSEKYR